MAYTTIDKPDIYFRIAIYNGNNNPQSISWNENDNNEALDYTDNMQPDMVWIKSRAGNTVFGHVLGDAVRTGGNYFRTDVSDANTSNANVIASFNSNGFSVGGATFVSEGSRTYVGWGWKAGTTSGINTTGSTITPIGYSFNATAGFSMVRYHGNETAGAKVPHGLAAVPHWILCKNMNNDEQWVVYHKNNTSSPETDHLHLDVNDATADDNTIWNDTVPDSVNFTIGSDDITNKNNEDVMAYVWTSIKGFSKFGGYTGNNNNNGPFVYLGFRPAWLLVKDAGSGQSWHMFDSKRQLFNDDDVPHLIPSEDDSEAEAKTNRGTAKIDLLSNGFKINSDGSLLNGTGSFIYMAFAENPFVNSNGVPVNAR
jgi:hypothetical protein